ncbi:hypothetical protein DDV96_09690 [Marixanthomonas spongiae]|uniref:Uncharacterized protein n=1 Tax=Marixanthomonas spongiae TaxID=2174845 RepID=A0A2U0I106_9FLAO|nr:hypothetical protein DDV96_09690 [Marixanthomonas spongiae]
MHNKPKEKNLHSFESPFQKYTIPKNEYQLLIGNKSHCLVLPEEGTAYFGILDNWVYVNTKDKLVFKTLIPISKIKYSKGYDREYCDVVYRYIELKNSNF